MRAIKKHGVKFLCLAVVTFLSVVPFYFMVMMSTHTTEEIFAGQVLLPGTNFLANLGVVVNRTFGISYGNSLFVSVSATVISVLFSGMMGYSLVAYRARFRNAIFNFILITMMIPSSIGLIGYMNEMRVLGLTRTLYPLVFVWCANGFGAFWMTQYMKASLQMEVVESARMDGCPELRIFFSIVLPCIRPAIGTLGLMVFLWSWNSYMLPLVLINNASNYTIPLYIQTLGNEFRNDYAAKMTGLLLSILPMLAAFTLGSKNFIRGLTAGAVKG